MALISKACRLASIENLKLKISRACFFAGSKVSRACFLANSKIENLLSSTQRGFTLIELMVSITLIFVMTALILPQMNNYSQFIEVRQEAQKVRALLIDAQNKSGGSNNECASPITVKGYGFLGEANSFSVFAYNNSDEECLPAINIQSRKESVVLSRIENGDPASPEIIFKAPEILPGIKIIRIKDVLGVFNDCADDSLSGEDTIRMRFEARSNNNIYQDLVINCNSGNIEIKRL